VVDYGSFSLWKTNEPQRQAVGARQSVKLRDDYDLVHLRGGNVVNTVNGAAPVAANARQSKASDFNSDGAVRRPGQARMVGKLAQTRHRDCGVHAEQRLRRLARWAAVDATENLAKSDPTVQWTDAYHPSYRLAPRLQNGKSAQTAQSVPVTVQLYRTTNTPASLASLRAMGGRCCASRRMC
jgi:hypothetical protein